MQQNDNSPSSYWGTFEIPRGTVSRWRIGLLTMWIERLDSEWRIATRTGDDSHCRDVEHTPMCTDTDLMSMDSVVRIGTSSISDRIQLTPQLADRAVVSKPIKPFYVASNQRVHVFVGSPLWLRIDHLADDKSSAQTLHEFPIMRPSDTWFGDNTRQGELCYASRSLCRLHLDDLPVLPHRAITMATVHNTSGAPLLLERMRLPVRYLPLFQDHNGVFWTHDVIITHESMDAMATVRNRRQPPALASKAMQVASQRVNGDDNLVMKVFSRLFR